MELGKFGRVLSELPLQHADGMILSSKDVMPLVQPSVALRDPPFEFDPRLFMNFQRGLQLRNPRLTASESGREFRVVPSQYLVFNSQKVDAADPARDRWACFGRGRRGRKVEDGRFPVAL